MERESLDHEERKYPNYEGIVLKRKEFYPSLFIMH